MTLRPSGFWPFPQFYAALSYKRNIKRHTGFHRRSLGPGPLPNRCSEQLFERHPALVEGGPDDRADHAGNLREGGYVFRSAHAAAGDGGQDLSDGGRALEGGSGVHAVTGDVGVENRAHAILRKLLREIQDVPAAVPLP